MAEQTRYMVLGATALDASKMASITAPDGGTAGLSMQEMAHLGKLILRGDVATLTSLCKQAGLSYPEVANTVSSKGTRHALWLGPDEVMLLIEAGAEEQLAVTLQKSLEDKSGSVVNITDGLCAFNLSGENVRDVLAKGCPLDLHHTVFGAGSCAQSLLAHAGVTLACLAPDTFILIGRTSFASYIANWLADASLEYGFAC